MIGLKCCVPLIAAFFLFTACSGGGTTAVYYTLQSSSLSSAVVEPPAIDIGVGPVLLPDYLDRNALVTRMSPNQLSVHHGHRWAGSLDDEILRVLTVNLKTAYPSLTIRAHPWSGSEKPALCFRLTVLSFDGYRDGFLDLKVTWAVEDLRTGATRRRGETHARQRVEGEDIEAYVAAMGRALAVLSEAMAKDVVAGD